MIEINENELEKLIRSVLKEDYYDETLPIVRSRGDIQVKYTAIEQVLQDLYKAYRYFESIKPDNDPVYSDKFNKLKRGIKSLEKLT